MCVVERDSIRTLWKKERRKFPRAEEVTNRRESLAPVTQLLLVRETCFSCASEEVDSRRNDGLRVMETPPDLLCQLKLDWK